MLKAKPYPLLLIFVVQKATWLHFLILHFVYSLASLASISRRFNAQLFTVSPVWNLRREVCILCSALHCSRNKKQKTKKKKKGIATGKRDPKKVRRIAFKQIWLLVCQCFFFLFCRFLFRCAIPNQVQTSWQVLNIFLQPTLFLLLFMLGIVWQLYENFKYIKFLWFSTSVSVCVCVCVLEKRGQWFGWLELRIWLRLSAAHTHTPKQHHHPHSRTATHPHLHTQTSGFALYCCR